jgi:hypothetical protein
MDGAADPVHGRWLDLGEFDGHARFSPPGRQGAVAGAVALVGSYELPIMITRGAQPAAPAGAQGEPGALPAIARCTPRLRRSSLAILPPGVSRPSAPSAPDSMWASPRAQQVRAHLTTLT